MSDGDFQRPIYLHNVKLDGDGEFVERFNECSDLFDKANDDSLSQEERENYWIKFIAERQKLELGW